MLRLWIGLIYKLYYLMSNCQIDFLYYAYVYVCMHEGLLLNRREITRGIFIFALAILAYAGNLSIWLTRLLVSGSFWNAVCYAYVVLMGSYIILLTNNY